MQFKFYLTRLRVATSYFVISVFPLNIAGKLMSRDLTSHDLYINSVSLFKFGGEMDVARPDVM